MSQHNHQVCACRRDQAERQRLLAQVVDLQERLLAMTRADTAHIRELTAALRREQDLMRRVMRQNDLIRNMAGLLERRRRPWWVRVWDWFSTPIEGMT